MSIIRFNKATKEIELIGSKAFIAENFHLVQDLFLESYGLKRKSILERVKTTRKPRTSTTPIISRTLEVGVSSKTLKNPVKLSAVEPNISASIQEPKITRPPLRKYFDQKKRFIRSEYKSVDSNQPVIGMGNTLPAPLSNRFFISSLKENLGLSKDQVEGIVRDAEREGRVRSNPDGSYNWV